MGRAGALVGRHDLVVYLARNGVLVQRCRRCMFKTVAPVARRAWHLSVSGTTSLRPVLVGQAVVLAVERVESLRVRRALPACELMGLVRPSRSNRADVPTVRVRHF